MNTLNSKLKNGQSVIGTMVTTFMEPDIVNMLQVCGLDFFIVDCEHGSIDYSSVAAILGRARALDLPALVRIPEARREVILKYMEAGASGLLLPNTDTAEQARALVECSKYYPMGNRGVSLLRAHTGFCKIDNAPAYMQQANEDTILMVQIESPVGVANLDEILKVEGIDVAFVGPNDLSQSLGIMGQYQHPLFVEAIDRIIATANANGKYSGIHLTAEPEELYGYMEKGMVVNLWSNDVGMLMSRARDGMAKLKRT